MAAIMDKFNWNEKLETFFLLRIVHYHVFRFSTASFYAMAFLFFLSFKPWCRFVILAQPHSHRFLELIPDWCSEGAKLALICPSPNHLFAYISQNL